MKVVGIFQVWRYLKADKKKDINRIEVSEMYSGWDFYELMPNLS